MSEKKIKVPDGMLEAATQELSDVGFRSDVIMYDAKRMLEAALRWLSENPIVPTEGQVEEMKIKLIPVHPHWANIVAEWQRRMFLAPEPEVAPRCLHCDQELPAEPPVRKGKGLLDPTKCPHRWNATTDQGTMERVVYCELCGWEYSRTVIPT